MEQVMYVNVGNETHQSFAVLKVSNAKELKEKLHEAIIDNYDEGFSMDLEVCEVDIGALKHCETVTKSLDFEGFSETIFLEITYLY
jgi:hypothetical protein